MLPVEGRVREKAGRKRVRLDGREERKLRWSGQEEAYRGGTGKERRRC